MEERIIFDDQFLLGISKPPGINLQDDVKGPGLFSFLSKKIPYTSPCA
jgi:hypothetical protein